MAQQNHTLKGLDALIAETESRLAQNPDYIALRALEKARAEIAPGGRPVMIDDVTGEELVMVPTGRVHARKSKAPSQLEASIMALKKAGEPLPTPILVAKVKGLGGTVGGKNPNVNLGSTLSRSDEFKSVRWRGESAWWFTGEPLPNAHQREAAE